MEYNIVEEYNVKKIYPSKLNIEIKPAKFIARTYNNSQLLVGSNGKLIKDKISNEKLPYIFGQFNSAEFLKFKKQIEFSKFNFSDFKNVSFYSSKRWDVLTVDDILIKLPKNKILEAINLAYEIIENNQFKVSKLIDLRISNHLIIK